jgi:hypothetical protein
MCNPGFTGSAFRQTLLASRIGNNDKGDTQLSHKCPKTAESDVWCPLQAKRSRSPARGDVVEGSAACAPWR